MKHLIMIALFLINSLAFSQNELNSTPQTSPQYDMHDLSISISVDSVEELESEFTPEAVAEFAAMASKNEKINFELICNYKSSKKNITYHKTYKVMGTTDKIEEFITQINSTKTSAIEGYKNYRKHD